MRGADFRAGVVVRERRMYPCGMTSIALPSRRHGVLAATALVASLGGISPARAQPDEQSPPPSTITLDRMDSSMRVGLQMGFDKIDRVNLSDGFVMRYEPYGQFVLPNRIVGLYGQLPIAHLFNFNGPDATGVGNLDVGAFFLPFHDNALILRTGLALSTASTVNNEVATNILATYERLTDFLLVAPNYTTLRLSASTVQQSQSVFFRGDLGLDLAIDKPSAGRGVFLHANAAVGVRASGVDLAVELVNLGVLDGTVNGGITNRFFHTLAVGLRTRGADQFHAGMVFPLDQSLRGEIWIFSLGYQHAVE